MSRVARFGRLYKMVKLTRLLKMLRIVRDKNKMIMYLTQWLKLGLGLERLMFFIVIFMLGLHVSACFFIITAAMNVEEDGDKTYKGTWLNKYAS